LFNLELWVFDLPVLGVIYFVCAVMFHFSATSYVYTTRRGKFQVWAEILLRLGLRGDEQILDLGCSRGAVLLMAASLLPRGKAIGIDVWKTNEQSCNALSVTQHNAEREAVAERVELHTADMRHLPFSHGLFDLVVSSMAIHNIQDPEGRKQAITEAVRVLKPGGRLVIADFHERLAFLVWWSLGSSKAGSPHMHFHDLRHSAATILLSMGVNMKVIQELLGHSDVAITLGLYSHLLSSMQKEAVDKWDDVFGSDDKDKDLG